MNSVTYDWDIDEEYPMAEPATITVAEIADTSASALDVAMMATVLNTRIEQGCAPVESPLVYGAAMLTAARELTDLGLRLLRMAQVEASETEMRQRAQ